MTDPRELATAMRAELPSLLALTERVVNKIDHKNLNLDVDFMRGIIPTSENIITAMWRELEPAVHPGRLVRLVLWETANNYVEYSGE